ncbi:MAG: recombinase family protein, partial [Chloroflexi bacterium]|nr:recombinase family protein [Chloroflexota bacterium]
MRVIGLYRPDVELSGFNTRRPPGFQFEQYCRDRSHELLRVVGIDGSPEPAADSLYQALRTTFDSALPPEAVLIPNSHHLANSLDEFVDRVLEIERLGAEVRCMTSPLLDPIEIGIKELRAGTGASGREGRIREAISSKASRGEVLGRTPYGYRKGLDGVLEPQPAEAAIVREIFELYAGTHQPASGEPPGLRRIAQELARRGVRTRAGSAWSTVTLAGLLRNPVYIGDYKRNAVRIPRNHPAIVDGVLFRRAQELLGERRPSSRARVSVVYVLAGLVLCGECGRLLRGLSRERRWRRSDGTTTGRVYRYYECPSRTVDGAAHSSIRADRLESAVREEIAARLAIVNREARVGDGERAVRFDPLVEAEKRVMRAARHIASGLAAISELTAARAELKRARSR